MNIFRHNILALIGVLICFWGDLYSASLNNTMILPFGEMKIKTMIGTCFIILSFIDRLLWRRKLNRGELDD